MAANTASQIKPLNKKVFPLQEPIILIELANSDKVAGIFVTLWHDRAVKTKI